MRSGTRHTSMDVRIFVKTTTRTVALQVKLHHTIQEVKYQIGQQENIKADYRHELILPGILLDNRLTISKYEIKPDTLLSLVHYRPSSILLFVKTSTGKLITLNVLLSDSIETVKKEIERDEGIPADQQRLVYCSKKLVNGCYIYQIELEDKQMVSDYNIHHGATLYIQMQILVKTVRGRTVPLEVNTSETIRGIKARILEFEDNSFENVRLKLTGKQRADGSYLFTVHLEDDDATLADYNITDRATLALIPILRLPEHTRISVKMFTGKTINLKVSPSHTVKHVKSIIQESQRIPPGHGRLVFMGKQTEDGNHLFEVPLKDNYTLSDYGIQNGSTIYLVMQISVKTLTGKTILVDVSPSNTIKEVKEKIMELEEIRPEHQHLRFTANRRHGVGPLYTLMLDDDLSTLLDYNIPDGSTIFLVMLIFVKPRTGNTITLEVTPSSTIQEIKEILIQKTGFPMEKQHLIYGLKDKYEKNYIFRYLLQDNYATLSEYYIPDKATIYLDTLERVTVNVPISYGGNKTIIVPIGPLDNVETLKRTIKRVDSSVENTRIQLKLNNIQLYDPQVMWDYNISENSLITCSKIY